MQAIVLTSSELATMLDCGVEQVEAKARAGVLPGLKFGRTWVFPVGAVVQALNTMAIEECGKRHRRPGGEHGNEAANDAPSPAPAPAQRARGGARRNTPPPLSPPPT